ncbi:MAG TPA: hypothetical protein VFS07_04835 [Gemmatimonadales bacterium]|jgi:hypothetical protein|nr:hypothetical protein [Gemmatimonadales bacterium]
MDFEAVLKILVAVAAAVAIPVGAYAAIVATRAIWVKGVPAEGGTPSEARLAELEARVMELEAERAHVAELEERLDFAERLLAQGQASGLLPRGGEGERR